MYRNNEIAKHYLMLKSIADEAMSNGDPDRAEELEMRVALFAQRFESQIFSSSVTESDLEITEIFADV